MKLAGQKIVGIAVTLCCVVSPLQQALVPTAAQAAPRAAPTATPAAAPAPNRVSARTTYGAAQTTATRVYGQATLTSADGTNTLAVPHAVAPDSSGNLYVADSNNNRVLFFPSGSTTATRVYGQANLTDNIANQGGTPTAQTLNSPSGVALDAGGNLYVADTANSRVLYYPASTTCGAAGQSVCAAARVYGQPDLTSNGQAGISVDTSATTLDYPFGVALDGSGNLYVADTYSNRALYYPASTTCGATGESVCTATRVYGQSDFVTQSPRSLGATSLNSPYGLALDSGGNLYVADSGSNRVVYFASGSTTATRVYGQQDVTTSVGEVSATSLNAPQGVAVDSSGNVYVADTNNQRVVYFASGSTAATQVYGQVDFTSNQVNKAQSSPDATTLSAPQGVAVDASGNLYVLDTNNRRALFYPAATAPASTPTPTATATTTSTSTPTPTSASTSTNTSTSTGTPTSSSTATSTRTSSATPTSTGTSTSSVTPTGTTGTSTATATGSVTPATLTPMPSSTATPALTPTATSTATPTPSQTPTSSATATATQTGAVAAVTTSPTVTLTATNTTVVNGSTTTATSTATATSSATATSTATATSSATASGTRTATATGTVSATATATTSTGSGTVPPAQVPATSAYGQPYLTSSARNNGGLGAGSLNAPHGVAIDASGNVYVADYGNNRVLYYPAGSSTATRVYGQPNFTSNYQNVNGTAGAATLYGPVGLAVDASGNLYVADQQNSRVLYFAAGSTTATRVYGQPDFTSTSPGTSAVSLRFPTSVALDASGHLYVADRDNHRVLFFPNGSTTATRVYGQSDFTTSLPNGHTYDGGNYVSATSLYSPSSVALDASGSVYVADSQNNRVLYFPASTTCGASGQSACTATRVYGQPGFTSSSENSSGLSATSLRKPSSVAVDTAGGVYAADTTNDRVLYFASGMTTATRVYGQPDFVTNITSYGGVTGNSFADWPDALAVDRNGNLYVADPSNHRVLFFQNGSTPIASTATPTRTATPTGATPTPDTTSPRAVWSWGVNTSGQLGNGTTTYQHEITTVEIPVQAASLTGVTAIDGGGWHTLALKSDGTVWAWGQNSVGQLGDGTTTDRSSPVQVSGLSGVIAISAGNQFSLAVKSDGTIWSWGGNDSGQLGDGTTAGHVTPQQVAGLSGVTAVAAGYYHALALKNDGTVWTWGVQYASSTSQYRPAQVCATYDNTGTTCTSVLSGVTQIAASQQGTNSLALKADGTVWGWGQNVSGELGNGTRVSTSTPTQATGLTGVVGIALGDAHALAVKSDGTVWAWGNNGYGQLGNGTTDWADPNSSCGGCWFTPAQVPGLTGATSVAAGLGFSLALKGDGSVWSWGASLGLGDGTAYEYVRNVPGQVVNLGNVSAIGAGSQDGLALAPTATATATTTRTPLPSSTATATATRTPSGSSTVQTLSLGAGWNLVSLRITPSDTTPAGLVTASGGYVDVILGFDRQAGRAQSYFSDSSKSVLNNLTTLQAGAGYWVHAITSVNLTVNGTGTPSVSRTLTAGWNLVGWQASNAQPVPSALGSMAANTDWDVALGLNSGEAQVRGYFTDPNKAVLNTLTQLQPGYGYWIHVNRATTWSYAT